MTPLYTHRIANINPKTIAVSPDGSIGAICTDKGNVLIFDPSNGKKKGSIATPTMDNQSVLSVVFTHDKDRLVVCYADGGIYEIDMKQKKLVPGAYSLGSTTGCIGRVAAITAMPEQQRDTVLLTFYNGASEFWKLGAKEACIGGAIDGGVLTCATHHAEKRLIARCITGRSSTDYRAELLNFDGTLLWTESIETPPFSCAISPDGRFTALAPNGFVHIYDNATGQIIHKGNALADEEVPGLFFCNVRHLHFIDERRTVSTGAAAYISVLDKEAINTRIFLDPNEKVGASAFCQATGRLIVADVRGNLSAWGYCDLVDCIERKRPVPSSFWNGLQSLPLLFA